MRKKISLTYEFSYLNNKPFTIHYFTYHTWMLMAILQDRAHATPVHFSYCRYPEHIFSTWFVHQEVNENLVIKFYYTISTPRKHFKHKAALPFNFCILCQTRTPFKSKHKSSIHLTLTRKMSSSKNCIKRGVDMVSPIPYSPRDFCFLQHSLYFFFPKILPLNQFLLIMA